MSFFKNTIKIFLALLLANIFSGTAFAAIQVNKSQYYPDETVSFTTSGGPWNVYDITTGYNFGGDDEYGSSPDVSDVYELSLDKVAGHEYAVIELTSRDVCTDASLSYEQCKETPEFVGEFKFRVISRPPAATTVTGGGGGPTAYRPEVSIYSPLDGKVYGNNIEVIYEATDKNDAAGQSYLGLGNLPVTIYFSKTADTRQRITLGTNLPDKGVFKWNTKDLPDGDLYNIIVSATDKVGETGETISGSFSLDHTSPVFTVKTDPTITRGEDVKIFVESSKELQIPPILKVTQNEFNSFDVAMTGDGFKFEGVYKVIGGYDGPAKISILGKDLAGNESDLIVSGGQFSVGILPPPKPIIISPLDRDIAPSGVVEVKGKARKDTEVILSLNGTDKFSKKPDTNGEFTFLNLNLRPDFNFGVNVISIVSKDAAGNISESADLNLKYNVAPEIFIEAPVKGQVLGANTQVTIKAADKNKDRLKFKYEVSNNNGSTWTDLNISPEKRSFVWDTTTFEDGDYIMRVTVSDGTSGKVAITEGLIIKNLLPTFSFTDGDKTVTNKKEIVISGVVTSSTKMPIRPNLLSVEYSLDGGGDWIPANILSGLNTSEIKFNISLNFSEEGTRHLLLRAKDDREIYGRGIKTVIVIFEPPTIPSITSLKEGTIIDNSFDGDKLTAGVQIKIEGTSKPNVFVRVVVDGVTFSGK
nr:hypothetical protein [Candidatus Paceibacterota bacterium]